MMTREQWHRAKEQAAVNAASKLPEVITYDPTSEEAESQLYVDGSGMVDG
jgi:hypothetical protein